MQRVAPQSLTGPRAYFTAFDPKIVDRTEAARRDELQINCERKLKLLLLLKTNVVCAASHLRSPIAHRMFQSNKVLLENGIVIPALRDNYESVDMAVDAAPDVKAFYRDHVSMVVDWPLSDNTTWFRDKFIDEISKPKSVLRCNATGLSQASVDRFIALHQESHGLGREPIDSWASGLSETDRRVILAFREFIYHLSGARVVNCESALPQEEYLDFDLADLSQQRTRLSDDMVFWKIFLEQALSTLQMRALPIELLDILTFQDILQLRAPLLSTEFQRQYDELLRSAVGLIRGENPPLIENIERLDKIRRSIETAFSEVFDKEIMPFLKKRSPGFRRSLLSNSVSVALGVVGLGLLPSLGLIAPVVASSVSLLKDSTSFFCNVNDFRNTPSNLLELVKSKEQAIQMILARNHSGAEDIMMLDVVNSLTSTIAERMKIF